MTDKPLPFKQRALKTITETITDPGVGFGVTDSLLFFQTGGFGLGATIAATVLSIGMKGVAVWQPAFLEKDTKLNRLIKDDRTPLRLLGVAMLMVAGTALGGSVVGLSGQGLGVGELLTQSWQTAILPAVTSATFAVANFKIANSISAIKNTVSKTLKQAKKKSSRFAPFWKGPDTYLAVGLAGAGLMSGGLSLLALPLVAVAYGVSMRNVIQNKPESAGHPKIWSASSCGAFGLIGLVSGNFFPAAANLMNAVILTNIEGRVTKGGLRQVVADIKKGFKSRKAKQSASNAQNTPAPKLDSASKLQSSGKLSRDMGKVAVPQEQNNKKSKFSQPSSKASSPEKR